MGLEAPPSGSGYPIVARAQYGPTTFLLDVYAPDLAKACEPGQFVMVRIDETGERIPLTISDFDRDRGTVTIVVQAVGKTTFEMLALEAGERLLDVVGPLGCASHVERRSRVVLVGGGLGVAPIFPLLRRHAELGSGTISIIGFRSADRAFWTDRFETLSDELRVATDDGSLGIVGTVADVLEQVLAEHDDIDEVVAIGPLAMMRACAEVTRPRGIPTVVSLNSIMVDGTGMCGSCRVTVGGRMRFACVDGPDFDGHAVDFDELALRMGRFAYEERACLDRYEDERRRLAELGIGGANPAELAARTRAFPMAGLPRARADPGGAPADPNEEREHRLADQDADVRPRRIDPGAGVRRGGAGLRPRRGARRGRPLHPLQEPEVHRGLSGPDRHPRIHRGARREGPAVVLPDPEGLERAPRGLRARLPAGDPVRGAVRRRQEARSGRGRSARTVRGRFRRRARLGRAADDRAGPGKRVAVVGSGPAGLACAGDLARAGVDVTVFEALHVAGGVMKYGIPEFRLPNDTIDIEIEALEALGVRFELDAIVGQLYSLPQLLGEMGFHAVFIGTGAGTPRFMAIPGESLNGVVSANEFLTRVNLMQGFRQPLYDTPVGMGKRVAVIGAGNTAMDASRVALRMGAERVFLVYRRTANESPARAEELHHAIEEGIECRWLTNPTLILGDDDGWVAGLEVIRMELGEPDASGRPSPHPVPGTEELLDVDMVIEALGTAPNPTISRMTHDLETNERGYLVVDPSTQMTSVPGIFAGGDIVTGSATVILAMGAGRRAAAGILGFLGVAGAKPTQHERIEAMSGAR